MAVARNVRQSGARVVSFGTPPQKQGRVDPWMAAEQTSEFEAGIAGRTENRGFKFRRHHIVLQVYGISPFVFSPVEAYLSIIMNKYSFSIVNGLPELSSRNLGSTLFGLYRSNHDR